MNKNCFIKFNFIVDLQFHLSYLIIKYLCVLFFFKLIQNYIAPNKLLFWRNKEIEEKTIKSEKNLEFKTKRLVLLLL